MQKVIWAAVVAISVLFPAWTSVPAASAAELFVTIYGDGRALVREVRSVDLPASGEVILSGVPGSIRPETVAVRSVSDPGSVTVRGFSLNLGRPDADSLLERFVGRELTVILPDTRDADGRVSKKAVLLSAGPQPVFDLGGDIWVGPHLGVLLPGLPEGVDAAPALRMDVANSGPSRQDLELSYLVEGLSWNADYALVLDRPDASGDQTAALTGWASIRNNARTSFPEAVVRLVAGEVGRANAPVMMRAMESSMAMDKAGGREPERTTLGDYHLYSLDGRLDLGGASAVQARLMAAPSVGVRTRLVSRFQVSRGQHPGELDQRVDSELTLVNEAGSGLGKPMPAGTVRVYRLGPDGAPLLVGEDRLGHTPVGEEAVLRLGSSFDVTVKRVQVDYASTGKRSARMTWEITARNGSEEPRHLRLLERLPGQWSLSGATLPHEKLSSGEVAFDLLLPPSAGSTTLRYTATLSW